MGKINVATGENCWPWLLPENTDDLSQSSPLEMSWLEHGGDGEPVVALHFKLPNGRYVYWDTKMSEFVDAVMGMEQQRLRPELEAAAAKAIELYQQGDLAQARAVILGSSLFSSR